jgi:hypothetical protein
MVPDLSHWLAQSSAILT